MADNCGETSCDFHWNCFIYFFNLIETELLGLVSNFAVLFLFFQFSPTLQVVIAAWTGLSPSHGWVDCSNNYKCLCIYDSLI